MTQYLLSRVVLLCSQSSTKAAAAAATRVGSCRLLSTTTPAPDLVHDRNPPAGYEPQSALVYRDFVSKEEADQLVGELRVKLKRSRYQRGHWDSVIVGYRETELLDEASLSPLTQTVLDRTRGQLRQHVVGWSRSSSNNNHKIDWLPVHCIDLARDGELKAHVDSVRFSGELVAGLSLQSSAIMRLKEEPKDDDTSTNNSNDNDDRSSNPPYIDLLLPPRSLYVLTGPCRYRYTHQLRPTGATFGNESIVVERDDRLSLIFRDAKTILRLE